MLYGGALTLMFPREMGTLPAGMRTPIIAFELARSRSEVEAMFGGPGEYERDMYKAQMDSGNRADFVFLVLYGMFFVAFSRALVERGGVAAKVGVRLAGIAASMDVIENIQLLAITNRLGGDYGSALSRLQWVTWLKWFAIALIVASWVPALWALVGRDRVSARTTAGFAVFTTLMTVAAFLTRGVAAELMALGVALTMLGALTLSFRSPRA
jgi:hypothetical protein